MNYVYSVVKWSCDEESVVYVCSSYEEAENTASKLNRDSKGQGILFYVERDEN